MGFFFLSVLNLALVGSTASILNVELSLPAQVNINLSFGTLCWPKRAQAGEPQPRAPARKKGMQTYLWPSAEMTSSGAEVELNRHTQPQVEQSIGRNAKHLSSPGQEGMQALADQL